MKMIRKVISSGLPLIPAGEYPAVFEGYQEKKGLKFGDALRLEFKVSEGDQEGVILDCLARDRLSPQTKLGQIVSVLLGETLKEDTELDFESLKGSPCVIMVSTVKSNTGDFSTIQEVRAA